MATALDMIRRARRLLNALGVGQTLQTELANDGLVALNAMLDAWSIDGLLVHALQSNTFALTGSQTYTVGTGGTFNMTRPDRIESAFCTISNTDYPLDIIDNEQWNQISDKNITTTIPSCIKYDAFVPLGTLSIYPKSTGTITLNTYKPLQAFTNLSEVLVLPRGYERAITFNLALEIAAETGRQVPQQVMMIAIASKAAIQRINADEPILQIDPMYLGRRGNILAGFNG